MYILYIYIYIEQHNKTCLIYRHVLLSIYIYIYTVYVITYISELSNLPKTKDAKWHRAVLPASRNLMKDMVQ